MTTNTRQAYILLILVLCFVAGGSWLVTEVDPPLLWSLRIGTPLALLFGVAMFVRALKKQVRVPNPMRALTRKYFESKGISFAPRVETADGRANLSVYFLNRFERPASIRISARPPLRSLWFTRHKLRSFLFEIECPPGAFGVARLAFPIPQKYQGRRLKFDLAATTRYPLGRGKNIHPRAGTRVTSIQESSQANVVLAFLFFGPLLAALMSASNAKAPLDLPTNVDEFDDGAREPDVQILEQPGADEATTDVRRAA